MSALSPLTRDRLAGNCRPVIEQPKRDKREPAEEVTMWRCPVCAELHDWESEAEDCCQGAEPLFPKEGDIECPVCGGLNKDHHDAANCCLWKDLDAAARFRIACAVEAGADWSDAIALEGGAA